MSHSDDHCSPGLLQNAEVLQKCDSNLQRKCTPAQSLLLGVMHLLSRPAGIMPGLGTAIFRIAVHCSLAVTLLLRCDPPG